mmetsp:Transcript_4161/g.10530  ORF Transcript_4161/g.10530 Transcript_4161/m.10530 type:complete len:477 (-) Transcript_4161:46-1476(-)
MSESSLPATRLTIERDEDEHSCQVVLLLGPPASGKSTLGKTLAAHFGYTHFDVGKHIRENIPTGADIEDFANDAVEHILRTEKFVLLNGFPKYTQGWILLTRRFHWVHLQFVLRLQLDDIDVLVERAAARHMSGERPEDDETNFRERLKTYEEHTLPMLGKVATLAPVFTVDAARPKEEVKAAAFQQWSVAQKRNRCGLWRRIKSRRDADEEEFEVVVCLMSGEERMRPLLPPRAKPPTLRRMLEDDGEIESDLNFFLEGREIRDNDQISLVDGFHKGCTIHMVRENKPPPPPSPSSRSPVCFTSESLACVLGESGEDVEIPFSSVHVGNLVRTRHGKGKDCYRRVQRVWAHHWARHVETFELAPGCRLTPGHPVMRNGRWVKPEALTTGEQHFEEFVYQLEVEGHVDTALVGGIQCALLGCYCGEDFGWNVFTRKTVKCDKQPCPKCAKAYLPGLDFNPSKLPKHMMPPARFEPY